MNKDSLVFTNLLFQFTLAVFQCFSNKYFDYMAIINFNSTAKGDNDDAVLAIYFIREGVLWLIHQ